MRRPSWVFPSSRGVGAAALAAALALPPSALPAQAAPGCPPPGWSRERLEALAGAGFQVASAEVRDALALDLLPCLADPDPFLRDRVAFEALAHWMRGDGLPRPVRRTLLERLLPALEAAEGGETTGAAGARDAGFRGPFHALVLAEVARTDRMEPFLEPAERARLLRAAAGFLAGVRDYRGYDESEGWRHGVAHGADLLMQLALNPAVDRSGLDRILDAVAAQVAPAGTHFYAYGEGERLARPVLFVAGRGLHSAEEWSAWLARLADPAPLPAWSSAFGSQAGLAKRHNTAAFLLALYAGARESGSPALEVRLLPGLRAALAAVP